MPGMPVAHLLHGVGREDPSGVDCPVVDGIPVECCHVNRPFVAVRASRAARRVRRRWTSSAHRGQPADRSARDRGTEPRPASTSIIGAASTGVHCRHRIRDSRRSHADTGAMVSRSSSRARDPHRRRPQGQGVRRAHQAARHRAAARHDGAGHGARGASGIPNLWLVLATLVGGSAERGLGERVQLLHRPRHRPRHEAHAEPPARHRRAHRPRGARVRLDHRRRSRSPGCWVFTNWLAAVLSLAAILFYVLVYTLMLKRRTPQNIVWGGAAGCMPVLIGWAAVTGSLDWAPVILFGIVFLWTPPHYWPLSMRYRDDYAVGERADARRRARPHGRRPAGRALRLGDGRLLAAADPDRADGRALRGRRGCVAARGSSSRRTASTRRRSATARSSRCGCSTRASPT